MTDSCGETLQQLYGAASGAGCWRQALASVADLCGAESAAIVIADETLGLAAVHAPRADPAVTAAYSEYWWAKDPTVGATQTAAVGRITSLEATGRDLFLASEFHNEFWRRSGLGAERLAANLLLRENAFASIVLHASARRDEISARSHRALGMVLPHLVQAIAISRRMAELSLARAGFEQVASHQGDWAVAVDAFARPVIFDDAGEAALSGCPALSLRFGALVLDDHAATRRMRELIASCAPDSEAVRGGAMTVPESGGEARFALEVTPWTPPPELGLWSLGRAPVAFVVVKDRQRERRSARERVRARYGLTPAEATLALETLNGGGRNDVAARLGVSVSTARTHLTRIYEKTGTTRLAELVALLLRDMR